jgi:NAD(P)-dependent dehydrogenase (short-subunit alcohol dehydrogenase family)
VVFQPLIYHGEIMGNHPWNTNDIPSLTGKTALVTGANSGLGYHATLELARKGAHVVMACRTPARAQAAFDQILAAVPGASLEIMPLDLSSLASIRSFVDTFRQKYSQLHIQINNAGVMGIPRSHTADGFEMQFGTNHLGHFALTGLLLSMVCATPQSRIVTVSSMMHQFGVVHFDDLMGERHYDAWAAYSQSKLANLLFAYELQRKLTARQSATLSIGAHPGYAATHLQFVSAEMQGSNLQRWFNQLGNSLFAQSAAQGALSELYAATAPEVEGGTYIGPDGIGGLRGYPKVVKSNARSYDQAVAQKLWQVSEELTGVTY